MQCAVQGETSAHETTEIQPSTTKKASTTTGIFQRDRGGATLVVKQTPNAEEKKMRIMTYNTGQVG